MKKSVFFLMALVLCLLCGCNQAAKEGEKATPTEGAVIPSESELAQGETSKQPDWHLPIDVDDPEEPTTAETEPQNTEPDASAPATEPNTPATEPVDVPPQGSTTPEEPSRSTEPIELPMIPG